MKGFQILHKRSSVAKKMNVLKANKKSVCAVFIVYDAQKGLTLYSFVNVPVLTLKC